MTTAILLVREVQATRLVQHNGEFPSEQAAIDEGHKLCLEGNVDSFAVFVRAGTYERRHAVVRTDVDGH